MLPRLNRSLVIAALIMVAASSAAVASRHHAAHAGRTVKPNIILIQTDDQALSQFAPQYLPHITKLLKGQGTSFEHAYITTPLCCPSRAGLLTGQYGHNNGVLQNNYPSLRGKGNVLPVWLHQAGYVTAHVGKFLNRYHRSRRKAAVAPGWDQWYTQLDASEDTYYDWDLSRNGKTIHYGHKNSDYAPLVFQRSASRLVRRFVPRKKPLYLELDEIAPHGGHGRKGTGCAGAAQPAPRDVGKFSDVQLPHPPSFNEADMSDKPSFLQTQPLLTQGEIDRRTRSYRCGLGALQTVDRTVARLYNQVKRMGELGRTVFIFYTDQGIFFGEHRVGGGKLYPYEEADKTPLYVRLPARYRNGNPRVAQVSDPVANIDFAPTMLRLAKGVPCPRTGRCRVMDGRSLLPLLRGKSPAWAPDRPLGVELHLKRANGRHAACVYSGVRVPGEIFVRHTMIGDTQTGGCVHDVQRERYNLNLDPYELQNLCTGGGPCPADAEQQKLRRLLARIHQCSGIRGRDPMPPSGHYCG
jgi:arylsulfatase A-like enzyme